jgi:hypothetical protein
VMSVSCHTVGEGGSPGQSAQAKTRNCPSGSCTTYDIPGHSR